MPKSVFTDAYASLLETVVEARKALGVSQVELARRLGKTQPFVSYFERGERRIDVIEFYAIMRALEVDPVHVFAELVQRLPERVEI
jgi:transcriptional regulator with XRE-family HTH domain